MTDYIVEEENQKPKYLKDKEYLELLKAISSFPKSDLEKLVSIIEDTNKDPELNSKVDQTIKSHKQSREIGEDLSYLNEAHNKLSDRVKDLGNLFTEVKKELQDIKQQDLLIDYYEHSNYKKLLFHFIIIEQKFKRIVKNKDLFKHNFLRVAKFIENLSKEFYLKYKAYLIIPNLAILDDESIDVEWIKGGFDLLVTFPNNLNDPIMISGGNFKNNELDAESEYDILIERVIGWLTYFAK